MLIDLVQLRTFVAVADEQHLTRAAERLHISQSAASAHVRAIEHCLGTQLFVRTNRSLELTRAGQLLALKARALLNEEALFTSFARELRGEIEGQLTIATSSEPRRDRRHSPCVPHSASAGDGQPPCTAVHGHASGPDQRRS